MGWSATGFATLVTTVARFHHSSGAEALLGRLGKISGLVGIRYWSTTHQRWQPLIVSASALTEPTGGTHRQDFSNAELAPGSALYFQQSDSLAGKATYRMRIINASPDRLIFETENVTALRFLLVTLFPPHQLQGMYFLERESTDVWRYYSVTRTGKDSNNLMAGHDASAVNRAVAFFRYMAGIPTDEEPPAAR